MTRLLATGSLLTAGGVDAASAQRHPSVRQRVAAGRTAQADVAIRRSELARALRQFSRQTGRQVGFAPALVRGRMANAVAGRFDPGVALTHLLSGTGLTFRAIPDGYVLVAAAPPSPIEPPAPAPSPVAETHIVVIGTRIDDADVTDVKRRALQSIDVLTEAEIARLPDTSLADVVRRIPGLQLSVRAGGGIVTIRGLSQTEDRINGRNLSNTVVRGFDIAALPSDIVSGIDVYKTPSASQIEGGIGGVIDFRTRRPFDGKRFEATATLKGVVGDLDGPVRPYVSGHIGGRFETAAGEVGLLIGASRQAQDIAQDLFRIGGFNPLPSGVAPGGKIVEAPVNVTKRYLRGTKALTAGYASAQLRPSASLEVTADVLYNHSALDFATMSLRAALAQAANLVAVDVDAGGTSARGGRWTGVPIVSDTNQGTGTFRTLQRGLSARYYDGAWTIFGDLSRTTTGFDYRAPTVTLNAEARGVDYSADGAVPRFTIDGIDPASAAIWRFGSLNDYGLDDRDAETAIRLDGTYALGGVIASIKAGVRRSWRSVDHRLGVSMVAAPAGMPPVDGSGMVGPTRSRLFDADYPQPRWIAATRAALAAGRIGQVRALFGVDPAAPDADPAFSYHADEMASSAYVEATFGASIDGIPVAGNAGVRYAGTDLRIAGAADAVAVRRSYDHWLPSVNVRAELDRRLYLRLAYSRQISRPAFNLLAPTVSINTINGVGEAGNPLLKPLIADQYDAALEYYSASGGSIHAAAFYKRVGGLIRTRSAPETIDGRSFLVSRPFNIDQGWIGGIESGFARRFTELPGLFGGLGMQASYTFIDSFDADNGAGVRVPLEQMSRHNYAIATTYDRAAVSAAVTWIWRSRIVQLSAGDAAGRPLYRDPYGQLDATATVALTPRIAVSVSAINLLQRRTTEYFQATPFLSQTFIESRRFVIGLSIRPKPK